MRVRRLAIGLITLIATFGVATGATAASCWYVNNMSRTIKLSSCEMIQSGHTNYGSAMESSSCAGSVGVQVKYGSGSNLETSSITWGATYARVDRTSVAQVGVHH
ncbi:hypothetical protein EDD28_2677 [Salana multivorans]|uniref:Uncharacterized protein n=1 Tax=Salana multivorans TaxID=120377 RepID=A0A3N2D0H5_9MICO|nr:hypothetical protein [Salana multivorans]ROR93269.1 hypothetical protein EDD28_2677 [Salana multivorans]